MIGLDQLSRQPAKELPPPGEQGVSWGRPRSSSLRSGTRDACPQLAEDRPPGRLCPCHLYVP